MFGGQSKPINTLFTLQHTPNKIFVAEKSKFLCGLISSPASFARFDSFSRSWLVVEWWSCNLTAACVKRHLCRDHPMTPPTVSDEIATIGVFCKFWDNPTGPQHFLWHSDWKLSEGSGSPWSRTFCLRLSQTLCALRCFWLVWFWLDTGNHGSW